jgi:hypothetical protein
MSFCSLGQGSSLLFCFNLKNQLTKSKQSNVLQERWDKKHDSKKQQKGKGCGELAKGRRLC